MRRSLAVLRGLASNALVAFGFVGVLVLAALAVGASTGVLPFSSHPELNLKRAAAHASPRPTSSAASCAGLTGAQERAHARLIFDAVALPGRSQPRSQTLLSPARFAVVRYLKGGGPRIVEVQTDLVAGSHAGGYTVAEDGLAPRAGQRWRIYGQRIRSGVITTSICAGSRRLTQVNPTAPLAAARGPLLVLLRFGDLGEIRGRCAAGRVARLLYVDRSRTGVDVRVRVGDGQWVHTTTGREERSIRVPSDGTTRDGATRFASMHLIAVSTREPEQIRASVELDLTREPRDIHPSGCGLAHASVDLTTRSHGR